MQIFLLLAIWLVLSQSRAIAAETNYFASDLDRCRREWFSEFLSEMQEKPIWEQDTCHDLIFRLLYLPSYEHPICVRLEHKKDGETILYGKEADGKAGFTCGKLIREEKTVMSPKEYALFLEAFPIDSFFHQPTEAKNESGSLTLGGSEFMFEANADCRYHVIGRDTDTYQQGNMRDLAIFLLEKVRLLPSQGVH